MNDDRRARVGLMALAPTAAMLVMSPSANAHEIFIGQTAGGRLATLLELEQPFPMMVSPYPEFSGFATGLASFAAVGEDMPADDLFLLSGNSNIVADFVSATPGIRLFYGLSEVGVGETMPLGTPIFDIHPVFNVPTGQVGEVYICRFVLRDLNGISTASAAFDVQFELVPAPGVMGVAALGLLASTRRRRV